MQAGGKDTLIITISFTASPDPRLTNKGGLLLIIECTAKM